MYRWEKQGGASHWIFTELHVDALELSVIDWVGIVNAFDRIFGGVYNTKGGYVEHDGKIIGVVLLR